MQNDRTAFGIYAAHPQGATAFWADLRLLSRLVVQVMRKKECLPIEGVLSHDVYAASSEEVRDHEHGRESRSHSALLMGVSFTASVHLLKDHDRAIAFLRDSLPHEIDYGQLSPQLQACLADTRVGRRRTSFILRHASISTGDTDMISRARAIPSQFWANWTAALAPTGMPRRSTARALSVAALMTGSGLSTRAVVDLLDTRGKPSTVTRVLRRLYRSPIGIDGSIAALQKLAAHLDETDTPIDYARRRALDYRELLPPHEWTVICDTLRVHPGHGDRYKQARRAMYELLTGCSPSAAPHSFLDDRHNTGIDAIPIHVMSALAPAAQAFLGSSQMRV